MHLLWSSPLRRLRSPLGRAVAVTVAVVMEALTWAVAIWEAVVAASTAAEDMAAFTVEGLVAAMVAPCRYSSAAYARTATSEPYEGDMG